MTVSTHILDAVAGGPAAGVSVSLSLRDPGGTWLLAEAGVTDPDGRIRFATETTGGVYRLTFATGLTGDQMLGALRERLKNNADIERTVAATELRMITRLRVAKALAS